MTNLCHSPDWVVPLPAARRPTSSEVFVCAIGQLHDCGVQSEHTNPFAIRAKLCGICRSETASQSAISVLPEPHSATTLAFCAKSHRLLTPIIARVWPG